MSRLRNVLDSPGPHIAVVVTELAGENPIDLPPNLVDVVELRIDKFSGAGVEEIEQTCRAYGHVPLLATIRIPKEGGDWRGTEAERAALFTSILPRVDGIDIELAAQPGMERVIRAAHAAGKVVILSHHDFEGTPSPDVLERLRQLAEDVGGDYCKVATMANTPEDFARLVTFVTEHGQREDVIAVGMGTYGPLSRIALPTLGSRLTYAAAGEVGVVPGQLGYAQTHALLASLCPRPE